MKVIQEYLAEKGHEVTNIHNIRHRISKVSLPLFYIDLKPNENNKAIYNIKNLARNIVSFEPPHIKKVIPQCARCQEYGHTKNYCRKTTRCVKCDGDHLTEKCERTIRDNGVKCVNCNDDHPANYRGCIVHKQLQQKLYPTLRAKIDPMTNTRTIKQHPQQTQTHHQTSGNYKNDFPSTPNQNNSPSPPNLNNITYAQIARSGPTTLAQMLQEDNQTFDVNIFISFLQQMIQNLNKTIQNQQETINKLTTEMSELKTAILKNNVNRTCKTNNVSTPKI